MRRRRPRPAAVQDRPGPAWTAHAIRSAWWRTGPGPVRRRTVTGAC